MKILLQKDNSEASRRELEQKREYYRKRGIPCAVFKSGKNEDDFLDGLFRRNMQ